MAKNRGLEDTKRKLGDLEEIISDLLEKKNKIVIFEAGCGYGKIMIELAKKFRNRVNITGMNLVKKHGTEKQMIELALKDGVASKEELKEIRLPKFIYGDASKKIPLKPNSVDLVYSQTSALYFPDKLRFYEEVARILTKDGVCRITSSAYCISKAPTELKNILKIYNDSKIIPFKDYIKNYNNIKIIKLKNGREFVEITKGKLKFDAKLISTLNLRDISDVRGVQSIYSLKQYHRTSTKKQLIK